MIVGVGTTSPLKIRAVTDAFKSLGLNVSVRGMEAVSGVPDQPFGFQDIKDGATNRAYQALKKLDAHLGIGIESGIVELYEQYYDVPCVVVIDIDGVRSITLGAFLPIPNWAVEEVNADGTELGVIVQKRTEGKEKDPHHYFSAGAIKRETIIAEAIRIALNQTRCPELYDTHQIK